MEIEYASLAHPEPEYRVIQPHTVVHSGYRWHVRAWCEKNSDFRDFVLSRISDEPEIVLPWEYSAADDEAWQAKVAIKLKPDPRLNKAQRALIARDYGMVKGQLVIETRGALVSYVLQQLRVDPPVDARKPEAQQIVVANVGEVKRWLIALD